MKILSDTEQIETTPKKTIKWISVLWLTLGWMVGLCAMIFGDGDLSYLGNFRKERNE